jgi:membrane protease subunit HflK
MQNFTPPALGKFLKPVTILIVIAGIVVLIMFGTSVFIVNQAEEAVITRLGKYLTTKGPGLQFKLPFGIDKNYTVNVKAVQTEQFGYRAVKSGISSTYSDVISEATMLTGDLNIINMEWVIQYRIVDSKAWVFNVNERTQTIRDVSRSVINMLVGDRAIMDIMSPERTAIEAAGAELMNETFRKYGLGIHVLVVKLQNVDPPVAVREAFDDVNQAIQDMNRLINEGQQVYNEEIPKARGEADRVVQIAQGYMAERVNRAMGDVARFNSVYDEYRRSPDVTRQRLYYEMIEEVFKNEKDVNIIDRNLRNFLPMMNLSGSGQQPQGSLSQGGSR